MTFNHFFKRSLRTHFSVDLREEDPVTKIKDLVLHAYVDAHNFTVSRYSFRSPRVPTGGPGGNSTKKERFDYEALASDQVRLLTVDRAVDGRLVEMLEADRSLTYRALVERLQEAMYGDFTTRADYEKPLKDEVRKIGHEMLTALGILSPGVNPTGKGAPVGKIQVRRAHTSSLYSEMTFSALGAELPSGLGSASFGIDMEPSPWDESGWALHLTPWRFSEMQLHWLHDIYPKVLTHLEQQGYAISPVGWGN